MRGSLLPSTIILAALGQAAWAAPLAEPNVFRSEGGVLDLLMIAQETSVQGFSINGVKGWAYQVCRRPTSGDACPAGTDTPYGGVRLALQRGDTLKIRLVNRLPLPNNNLPLDRAVDDPLLKLNPTNLHTHGLVVDATANTVPPPGVPVYGDFVFTSIFNPANGDPAAVDSTAYKMLHSHGDIVKNGVADYKITIPANHPNGMFWFHPHMHGISVNQISAGMAGVITIGQASNYACGDYNCGLRIPESMLRHVILKEMQVTPKGPQFQTDPGFCAPLPAPGELRNGDCPAADNKAYPNGGNWIFSVNGQQFPTAAMATPDGEVWRIQNASASVTYDLTLQDNATKNNMAFQLLAIDGVAINVPEGTQAGDLVKLGGSRFKLVSCPVSTATNASSSLISARNASVPNSVKSKFSTPVCISELVMMPSSRAEVWVSYRDGANKLAAAPAGSSATLRANAFSAGPAGDTWPQINLATVQFAAGGLRNYVADFVKVAGDALGNRQGGGIFQAARGDLKTAPLPNGCKPLADGRRRRIYFANMGDDSYGNAIFGLGYEETDLNGTPIAGTYVPVQRFDAMSEICLPLGKGNTPVNESWELINLSSELHNFHIHQTKFKVISATAPSGTVLASNSVIGDGIEADNIPLPWATVKSGYESTGAYYSNGACSVEDFKAGFCNVSPVIVTIPFTRIGKFVYHCHILEHEDGGMMQAIRVVPSAN